MCGCVYVLYVCMCERLCAYVYVCFVYVCVSVYVCVCIGLIRRLYNMHTYSTYKAYIAQNNNVMRLGHPNLALFLFFSSVSLSSTSLLWRRSSSVNFSTCSFNILVIEFSYPHTYIHTPIHKYGIYTNEQSLSSHLK